MSGAISHSISHSISGSVSGSVSGSMSGSMGGMTLIELTLVVVVLALGMSVAAPGFKKIMGRNQTTTQINELVTAINLARSEAAKISGVISVQATDPSDSQNKFGKGWCVVAGNPGHCDGTLIRSFPAPVGVNRINSESASLPFNAFGETNDGATRTFLFCAPEKQRLITITPVGRAKIDGAVIGDC